MNVTFTMKDVAVQPSYLKDGMPKIDIGEVNISADASPEEYKAMLTAYEKLLPQIFAVLAP